MSFDPKKMKYNAQGLVPVIAQDADSLEVLMLAWMNVEAVSRTLDTKKVTYWSRSRQSFWVKGETSGHTQELVAMRYDCDMDTLLVLVKQNGAACHTGRRSCFYTDVTDYREIETMKPIKGSP